MISTSRPSGDMPENTIPCSWRIAWYSGLTS